jgi:oligopeptide/dipeptide ABC transporter ATP-binding protein
MKPLLSIEKLHKRFALTPPPNFIERSLRRPRRASFLHAVENVSFDLMPGESIGLVGESGCGKSTLVRLVTRLLDPSEGHILFREKHIGDVAAEDFARHPERAQIQQIFQDPTDSLNPRLTAFDCIADPLRRLGASPLPEARPMSVSEVKRRVEQAADQVSLPRALLNRYPHQLSGGQKLRVGIARGIVMRPALLILDEPTSALDVSVQAVILHLLADLRRELGLSYLFVSHDLNVVRMLCDRVLVMYLGKVVESGPVEAVFANPRHPYTQALLSAVSQFDPDQKHGRIRLSEDPQSPIDPDPNRCRFFSRCARKQPLCAERMPELEGVGEHASACFFGEIQQ